MQRRFRTEYTKLYCTLAYKGLVPYTITILYSTQVGITVVCHIMLCILLYLTLHYLTPPSVSAEEVAINTSNAFQESMWKCNNMLYKFDYRFTYNSTPDNNSVDLCWTTCMIKLLVLWIYVFRTCLTASEPYTQEIWTKPPSFKGFRCFKGSKGFNVGPHIYSPWQ